MGTAHRIVAVCWTIALLFITPLLAAEATADRPFLHPLFTDHVVLQRDVYYLFSLVCRLSPLRRSNPSEEEPHDG